MRRCLFQHIVVVFLLPAAVLAAEKIAKPDRVPTNLTEQQAHIL